MTNTTIICKSSDSSFSENQREFFLSISTNSKLEFLWYGALAGGSYRGTIGTTPITNTGKRYHVAITYDGTLAVDSRVYLYIDGTQESTSIDLTA